MLASCCFIHLRLFLFVYDVVFVRIFGFYFYFFTDFLVRCLVILTFML